MKRYLFSLIAVTLTIVSVAFTTASENRTRFACEWFLYDNPVDGTGDTDDFPANLSEATNPDNYQPLGTFEFLFIKCPGVRKLCAICADLGSNGKPLLTTGTVIRDGHLNPYFAQPNEALRVPNSDYIREKLNF